MSAGKAIRTKIKSVRSTQKITKAMQMVAASKMRKAQERMQASRPYSEKIHAMVGHLAAAHPEYRSTYMHERDPKRVGFIVVSTDRGLCGGLNINMFKAALGAMRDWQAKGVDTDLCVIGQKGKSFFGRVKASILSATSHLGDRPAIKDLLGTVKVMLDAYREGRIDRLYVVHNRFVSTMSQTPQVVQLLPLVRSGDKALRNHWDYIYEPDAREVIDGLLTRYIESLVYQGVVENLASEQAARMVSMKAATDNAGNLINHLALKYNKARQAAITQEISEIVGGAAAV